ncbi:hypothetical protein OSB04_030825 [Centaurea solstitialis]|uniref:Retrotransposon gag domain-containing protein n=1 Tax=Centaurea solstitialis TaxID=347529 RepID=A0AA38SRW2_9ASTR|nr:hypothetical protein OSB04_030825 [Centaurea solstitialis]
MLRKQKEPLLEIDPEIEKTFRKRRRGKKKSQPSVEPLVVLTVIMADLPPPVQTTIHIADDKDRKIRDYATPGADQFASGIPRPDANKRFELKPVIFHIPGVAEDAVRLRLFPFTLRDRAKAWINSFRPNSLITWNVLAEKFLQKYFPPTRNVKLRNGIILFRQGEDETFSEAWERFKELLRQCPHHGIPHCIQLETFYNGLSNAAKLILDATAGGAFTSQTYNEGYQVLEKVANNNTDWSNPRELTPKINPTESDALKAMNAQLAALTKLVLNGNRQQVNSAVATPQVPDVCTYCGENHIFDFCPGNPEVVNVIGTQHRDSPFSQTYNANWRNHPNFSWRNNQESYPPGMNQGPNRAARPPFKQQSHYHQGQFSHFQNAHTPSGHSPQNFHQRQSPQNFQQRQPPALEAPPSLESVLKGFMNQTQASMRNFETQLGQLATEVKNRPQGSLPSDTEHPNREGKEQVKMISLRSADNLYDVVIESEPTLVDLEPTATTVPLSTLPTPDPTEVNVPLGVSTPVSDHPIPSEPQKLVYSVEEADTMLNLLVSKYFNYFTYISLEKLIRTLDVKESSNVKPKTGDTENESPARASGQLLIRNIHHVISKNPPLEQLDEKSEHEVWNESGVFTKEDVTESKKTKRKEGKDGKVKSSKGVTSAVNISKKMKLKFSKAWMAFLGLPLPIDVYKEGLKWLMCRDFLTKSYDIGGVISIMALSSLFILMTEHGLEYPNLYGKLYALLEPSIFIAKHRAKFLQLLDSCLKSPLLPAYLVASFAKKLSVHIYFVVMMTKSPWLCYSLNGLVTVCYLQEDNDETAKDASSIKAGIDLFNNEEKDLLKTNAMRSSLWEIDTLRHHLSPGVKVCMHEVTLGCACIQNDADIQNDFVCRFVLSLENDLTVRSKTTEVAVKDFSSGSYATIFREEIWRRVKQVPLAFYKAVPTSLFSESDFAGWSFQSDS